MKNTELIERQFKELIAQGNQVYTTLRNPPRNVIGDRRVDKDASQGWATRTLSFLGRLFGKDSEYYKDFQKSFKLPGYETEMRLAMSVLVAAWEDYQAGYLTSVVTLVTAEVFADFLEQGEYLLKQGYYQAACVITGAVLEDTLRKLCNINSISLPQKPALDWMNVELAKKTVYTTLVQKQITALADIRNKAAHGHWDQFSQADADNMVKQVREFVTAQMA